MNFNLYNKYFKLTFWLIIIVELMSFCGHSINILNYALFIIIILATFIISLWRLEYGFWIILTELFIGSFGYLFSYNVGDFKVSIRLGLFIVLFLAWVIHSLKYKKFEFKQTKLFWPFVVLISFIILGVAIGYLKHNSLKNVFFDVNGYLYFGLIFVAFTVINSWSRINQLLSVMLAVVSAMAIKTIAALFYFSHVTDEWAVRFVYTWIRDTRVGEIAQFTKNFFRVFFQSHIYALFVFLLFFIFLLLSPKQNWDKKNYRLIWLSVILSSLTLIISFSRSFWLALIITLILIFVYLLIKEKPGWRKIIKTISLMILLTTLELGFITFIITIKIPSGQIGGPSAANLVMERITTTEEAAIGSRWQLLKPLAKKFLESPIWGSGFGTTITYQTQDPRTKELSGGYYTTYSFEWGYLDIVVKIGILGLLAYLYFLWKIIKNGIELLNSQFKEQRLLALGLLFSLIALFITHFTTPYLNHPLGIGFLIICSAIFFSLKNNPSPS